MASKRLIPYSCVSTNGHKILHACAHASGMDEAVVLCTNVRGLDTCMQHPENVGDHKKMLFCPFCHVSSLTSLPAHCQNSHSTAECSQILATDVTLYLACLLPMDSLVQPGESHVMFHDMLQTCFIMFNDQW